MPLHYDIGPQDGPAVVRSGLQLLTARKNQLNLDSASVAALDVGTPHAVYDLHADEIANGGGLETAHASGFRYLTNRKSRQAHRGRRNPPGCRRQDLASGEPELWAVRRGDGGGARRSGRLGRGECECV